MSKRYRFQQHEIDQIINRFGKDFLQKVISDIEVYADKWALTSFQLIPSYSVNLVFMCISENYGHVVLKIGNPSSREILTEFSTLYQYNGIRYCRVFEVDIENGVILEECIQPGNPLREEKSLEKRLAVFCSLFKDLHITPKQAELFPTYTEWVSRITKYMSGRQDCIELYFHMKKAKEICLSVSNLFSQRMLLHGDLHHDNILLGKHGEYVIIDPKGVLGDPVFDIPRFILNEFDDDKNTETFNKINDIIRTFEKELSIPNEIIRQLLYVETIMAVCWSVEDGEDYSKYIKDVSFAEAILNKSY